MATKTPITTNIMSFKTFRSPDKIDYNDRNQFFIHHPNLSKSRFNRCPVPNIKRKEEEKVFSEFLKGFESVSSYKEIREFNPSFYDYSCMLMQQKKNDSSKKQLNAKLPSKLDNKLIIRIWDELFYQVASRKSKTVRQACVQLIITQHYLLNNKTLELKDISKLTILIPEIVINCFKPWVFEKCDGKLFGVQNLGIQEYRRVEQTLCCYVPGEVSHIENIMAKEYKEKSTRNLLRTEDTTEFTSETEIENLNDTTTTERNEISSEVAKELQKDKSFDISGSVTVSKDSKVFGSISANVSSGYSSNNSSSLSNTEAKNYAKEVTERALERIVQKTTEKRTYKMIKEFEENYKHGFDNRNGDKHVTGVYRWVDKIYDNQLVNYGKRLLFEADIPHPALFYKKAMEWSPKNSDAESTLVSPPKTLEEFGVNDASSITSDNIAEISAYYDTDIQVYEQQTQYIDVPFSNDTQHKSFTKTDVQSSIIIPEGFVADKVDGFGQFNYKATSGAKSYLKLVVSGYQLFRGEYRAGGKRTDNFNINIELNPNIPGILSFAISYRKVNNYSGTLKVKCISNPELFNEWQEETYLALQAAYQDKLDQYNEELKLQQAALAAENDQNDNENYNNPALNRLIEERELKRICIEMMSKPYCYDFGKNFNQCKTYQCKSECGENEAIVPNVIQNEELEKYTEFIKFFETAFQWEILTYVFYPYYYNQKCNWSELLQTKNDDPIFEAFLQSGMAKLLVPVRPQYEKAVMHYMETGEIYLDGDLVPETEDDRYLSLLAELGNQDEVTVEGKWKTRVPSTLTIIQANSSYLEDEKGLPCCDEDGSVFGSDENTLQNINPE